MRQRLIDAALVFLFALTGSGCTQFAPYRTQTLADNGLLKEAKCYSGDPHSNLPPCEDKETVAASEYAVQNRQYQYNDYKDENDKTGERRNADYHLAFVEFDDQGWFADRRQMEALFSLLRRLESEQKSRSGDGHVLILLYAHGWKHNASQCDNNVICFSRLLERMDILERHLNEGARRSVVGVYVGWRGLSLDAGPLTNLTFWTRKNAAERVGRGGVTELLARLNDYRRIRNPDRDGDKTQLVVVGHSFGGLVVYSALSHALMERAGRTVRVANDNCNDLERREQSTGGLTCYDTAVSFGDFVVLVNPAFEGSQYEPLFHIATNRCYRANQTPVMMTVTSGSDLATGLAFPLGRKASTMLEHATSQDQADSIVQAIGHDARYRTHELKWLGPPADSTERGDAKEEGDCGCPYLTPTMGFNWRTFKARIEPFMLPGGARPADNPLTAGKEQGQRIYDVYGQGVRLAGDLKYSANYPYLVVRADPEIIADHNTIYSEPFVRFLHSFFLIHIAGGRPFEADGCVKAKEVEACEVNGLVPCEQSCRLPDGRPCSSSEKASPADSP